MHQMVRQEVSAAEAVLVSPGWEKLAPLQASGWTQQCLLPSLSSVWAVALAHSQCSWEAAEPFTVASRCSVGVWGLLWFDQGSEAAQSQLRGAQLTPGLS